MRGSTVLAHQETFSLRSVVFRDVKIGLEHEKKKGGAKLSQKSDGQGLKTKLVVHSIGFPSVF